MYTDVLFAFSASRIGEALFGFSHTSGRPVKTSRVITREVGTCLPGSVSYLVSTRSGSRYAVLVPNDTVVEEAAMSPKQKATVRAVASFSPLPGPTPINAYSNHNHPASQEGISWT